MCVVLLDPSLISCSIQAETSARGGMELLMDRVSGGKNLTSREMVAPTFREEGRPFSFTINADNLQEGWTPTMLHSVGVMSFGRMSGVVVNCTTENFEHVMMLIESWLEADIAVVIRFPKLKIRPRVGTLDNPTFAGLDTEECYRSCRAGGFLASRKLRKAVVHAFIDSPKVTLAR